jgi:glycerate dehydrogenase
MKIVVLDADTLGRDLDLSPLSDCGEVQIYGGTSPDQITERLDGADAVLVNKVKLNSVTLAGNVSLRLICVAATGYDNIDIPYCRE